MSASDRSLQQNNASRRHFLRTVAAATAPATLANPDGIAAMTPWRPGELLLHHIATGRGNSTFVICPDGTTLLIDAGAIYDHSPYTISPVPDDSRRPGEWIAHYVLRQLSAASLRQIDFFVLTHLHNDHMGGVAPETPLGPEGFRLTGVTDVAAAVPIGTVLDRAFPDYAYPSDLNDPHQLNYRKFIDYRLRTGKPVERFRPGARHQIALIHHPAAYPDFAIQNLAANGEVWTGRQQQTRLLIPPGKLPTENMCSVALRIDYAGFRYYTGGDLPSDPGFPAEPWRDVESPVAAACGPVHVAVANHHGYVDAVGPRFCRCLQPRAFIVFAWDSAHPTIRPLGNMLSHNLYSHQRDVYATAIKPENRIATRQIADLRSQSGHVVIRVARGEFRVVVLDSRMFPPAPLAEYGPYPAV